MWVWCGVVWCGVVWCGVGVCVCIHPHVCEMRMYAQPVGPVQ